MRNLCWCVLFYGLFSLSSSAHVTVDVAGLTHWASKLSGYPEPEQLPIVQFVPQTTIDALVEKTGAGGAYPGGRVVYVSAAETAVEQEAIIVHEIVHYMQAQAGIVGDDHRCQRELEAARVEWSYRAIVFAEQRDFSFPWGWYQCQP